MTSFKKRNKSIINSFRNLNEDKYLPYLLLGPALFLVLLVTFAPVVQAITLAFRETSYLESGKFIGLQHFINFFKDDLSRKNLLNSVVFTFSSLSITISLAIGLALLLDRDFKGRAIFRSILIIPWVVSQMVTALLWQFLYSPLIGPLAFLIQLVSGTRVDILGNPDTAMIGLIVANVWRTSPYAMVLILAALQTVPRELYESAKIDGGNSWQLFAHITFPMIRNTLLIVVIILSIHNFNMIDIPLILTGGGPIAKTDVIGLRVYREAFVLLKFGSASAIATIMFIINVIISLFYIRVLRTENQ